MAQNDRQVKQSVTRRDRDKSVISGKLGTEVAHVFITREEAPRLTPIFVPINLVLVTSEESVDWTSESRLISAQHLISQYGRAKIQEWLDSLDLEGVGANHLDEWMERMERESE